MNTPNHENFYRFIQALYRDSDNEPLSRYSPGRAARLQATTRGNARKILNQRITNLFDRLTKKKGAL